MTHSQRRRKLWKKEKAYRAFFIFIYLSSFARWPWMKMDSRWGPWLILNGIYLACWTPAWTMLEKHHNTNKNTQCQCQWWGSCRWKWWSINSLIMMCTSSVDVVCVVFTSNSRLLHHMSLIYVCSSVLFCRHSCQKLVIQTKSPLRESSSADHLLEF